MTDDPRVSEELCPIDGGLDPLPVATLALIARRALTPNRFLRAGFGRFIRDSLSAQGVSGR